MVFGLFEGGTKLEVKLDKQAYKKGDTVNCTIRLKLKKPVEGAGVKAEFAIMSRGEPLVMDAKEKNEKRMYNDGEEFKFSFATKAPEKKKSGIFANLGRSMDDAEGYAVLATFTPQKGFLTQEMAVVDTDPPSGNF